MIVYIKIRINGVIKQKAIFIKQNNKKGEQNGNNKVRNI